ncbi:MAG: hypothetical protein ACD_71C00153G0002 [uncultured bacterium (gcode 4)]|uniref:Uncharacterized protein n=1 Tax=uncultured bacterium (gcode 4) TaxID=1234023 RepID=K1ZIY3_9BACT|nr:MAG: hypothetical protein ACD_71C00153G0002 [uncultured bacterium (gcode 4)]
MEDLEWNEDFQNMAGIIIDVQNKVLDLSWVRNPNNKVLKFKGFYLFPIFRKLAREIRFEISGHIPTKEDVARMLKKIYEEKWYTIINNTQRRVKRIWVDKDVIIANFGDEFQKFVREKVILKHWEYTPEWEREYLLNFEKISDEVFLEFIRKRLHESDRADLRKLFPEPTDADMLWFIACLVQERTRVLNGK